MYRENQFLALACCIFNESSNSLLISVQLAGGTGEGGAVPVHSQEEGQKPQVTFAAG